MIGKPRNNRKRRKIAMFIPDLGGGGAERVFVTLAGYFAGLGFQVDLVLAVQRGPLINEVEPRVTVVDLAADTEKPTWIFALTTLVGLMSYLRRSKPDVLLVTLTGANLTALVARMLSFRRFRLVIREAASIANVKSHLRFTLMKLLYPLADNIIVLTDHMKNEMLATLGLHADQISVIDNPIDYERIERLAQIKEVIEISSNMRPYVVVVGRLVEQKDIATAIRAVSLVSAKRPCNLVVIGEGPQKDELVMLSETLGISNRVFWLDYQSNPYPWMKQADAVLLTSKWEGYPNILLEAKSLGCPIVTTEYDSSVRQILSTYPKSLQHVVSVGDWNGMADAILKFLDNDVKIDVDVLVNLKQVANRYIATFDITMPE